jgi:release factor glutamine methyltransferase
MSKVKLRDFLNPSPLGKKISEKLIGDLFDFSKEKVFLHKNTITLSSVQVKKFKKTEKEIVERGVPYQYALKKSYFYGREFYVDKNVLIPRPETELLVQKALKYLGERIQYTGENSQKISGLNATSRRSPRSGRAISRRIRIIDVGTGSGCIIISTFIESASNPKFCMLNSKFYACDVSEQALSVARKNAKKHGVKIIFLNSDLLNNPKLPKKFDLILANLPYLPSSDLPHRHCEPIMSGRSNPIEIATRRAGSAALAMTELAHEPRLALDGGRDGLAFIKKLIAELPNRLAKDGLAILEIDPRQKSELSKFTKNLPLEIEFKKDLNNRTRLAEISLA